LIPIGKNGDFKIFNSIDGLYHHRDGSLEETDGTILEGANNQSYEEHHIIPGRLPKNYSQIKKGKKEEKTHYDDEVSYPYGMFKQKKHP
jgi:hypothetical protein